MSLRYALRRILIALGASGVFTTALGALFCPVLTFKRGWFAHMGDYEALSFVPVWRIDGRPVETFCLAVEIGLGFLVFASVWFVYPQFAPPPSPDRLN